MGLFGRDDRSDGNRPVTAEDHDRKKHAPASGATVTLIATTSHVEGEIKGAGEVRVEGVVKGKVDCSALVVVAPDGQVEGEIRAETTTIAGKVKGNIFASQKIELAPTANVQGDITSPRILIHEGATFEGQVVMTGKKGNIAPEPTKKTDQEKKPTKTEQK